MASSLDAIQGSGEVIKAVLCQVQAQFKLHKEIVFFNEIKKEEGTSDEKTESKDGLSLSFFFTPPTGALLSNNSCPIICQRRCKHGHI